MRDECKKCFNQVCKGVKSSDCKYSENFCNKLGITPKEVKTRAVLEETDKSLGYGSKWELCIGSDNTFGCYGCKYFENGNFDNCPVYKEV